jgi:hypothetical protein
VCALGDSGSEGEGLRGVEDMVWSQGPHAYYHRATVPAQAIIVWEGLLASIDISLLKISSHFVSIATFYTH